MVPDIRSRIHILICGDPSLAKTKLLKFTHKVVLGSISAIGKGASGGGLTAVVSKETDGTFTVSRELSYLQIKVYFYLMKVIR